MAKLISLKCPECGANLEIEDGHNHCFCNYCGTKISITNENEYIFRQVDEAEIKKAEVNKEVRLKELELNAAVTQSNTKFTNIFRFVWLGLTLALLAVGLGIWFLESDIVGLIFILFVCIPISAGGAYLSFKVIPGKENERIIRDSGGVKIPKSIGNLKNYNVLHLEQALKDIGFKNIQTINLHDLKIGLLVKEGSIDTVSINGNDPIIEKYYPNDSKILISYHGK